MESDYFYLKRIAHAFIFTIFESIKMIKELQQLSAVITRECHNVLRQIIQNPFDGMTVRCRECQNAGAQSFRDE